MRGSVKPSWRGANCTLSPQRVHAPRPAPQLLQMMLYTRSSRPPESRGGVHSSISEVSFTLEITAWGADGMAVKGTERGVRAGALLVATGPVPSQSVLHHLLFPRPRQDAACCFSQCQRCVQQAEQPKAGVGTKPAYLTQASPCWYDRTVPVTKFTSYFLSFLAPSLCTELLSAYTQVFAFRCSPTLKTSHRLEQHRAAQISVLYACAMFTSTNWPMVRKSPHCKGTPEEGL